jgi:hypothetical protein
VEGKRPSFAFADADQQALFEERAAIREYDGGLTRDAAERLAYLDVLAVAGAVPPFNRAAA